MSNIDSLLLIIRENFSKIRIPTMGNKVYNDECIYSFENPFSDSGLYVSISTFQGVGEKFLRFHSTKTGSKLYLHHKWTHIPTIKNDESSKQAPQKLGIGVEGGFKNDSDFELNKEFFLVIVQESSIDKIPLDHPNLPEFVVKVCQAVIDHPGLRSTVNDNNTWSGEEEKIVSKYANDLVQLDNNKKISNNPSTWKCEMTGESNNLWLNLSTGYIGGGRKNWDGSGGSGAALSHFIETGKKYPLCVKLGTITSHGADVWSYADDEDTLVIDPKLADHLSHWGIDIMKLEKTDKTLSEMEVDINLKYDWARILENGKQVDPISAPGLIGLTNIGSSCYLNSVMQVMSSLPEVIDRYYSSTDKIIETAPQDAENDFAIQMSKLLSALLSEKNVIPSELLVKKDEDKVSYEKYVVAPRMFKQLIGKGHREFSSGRQQDASEYFQHLLDFMHKYERSALQRIESNTQNAKFPTPSIFEFYFETRIQFNGSNKVKYLGAREANNRQNILELRIPIDRATNRSEVELSRDTKRPKLDSDSNIESKQLEVVSNEEEIRFQVPFEACLQDYFEPEYIEMKDRGVIVNAKKTLRFIGFPKYLMIKLARYTIDASWKQIKIDASVSMPDIIDLSYLRATGLQHDEIKVEDEGENIPKPSSNIITPDEMLVAQLVSMGFSENGCRRAAIATNNAGPDQAMAWVLDHMEDADFNNPLDTDSLNQHVPADLSAVTSFNPYDIEMLSSLGFTETQAKKALKATESNVERAAEWLFSHTDDPGFFDAEESTSGGAGAGADTGGASSTPPLPQPEQTQDSDGQADGTYEMIGIISHIGKNTDCGHYVCHIKKDNAWYFFNDDKVSRSLQPPLDCGFMYLYKRIHRNSK